MKDNLIEGFARYLFNNITGLDSNKFYDLGENDLQYWMDLSRNSIKHSVMLTEYVNEKYNVIM